MRGGRAAAGATSDTYSRIYAVVRRIPRGRVATYGQVAGLAGGIPRGARQVGYALHALTPARAVPWHRVVNAAGRISLPPGGGLSQRLLLEREGVRFDGRGRIDLDRYGWKPRSRRPAAPAGSGNA